MLDELRARFPGAELTEQVTADGIPTVWLPQDLVREALGYLKHEAERPFRFLYDLGAVDERYRAHRAGLPAADFSVFYHLVSYERNADLRLKVALAGETPSIDSVTSLWPAAGWYEREVWDMFGIHVDGHPDLRRILMPPWWQGHPLRKEHPARGTEYGPFELPRGAVRGVDGGPALQARGVGPAEHRGRPDAHVPQHRAAARRHARPVPRDRRPARRGDRPLPAGHRLPPPRRREDQRTPDVAPLHPLHRPHRLPERRGQQLPLGAQRGAALRHRRARPRPGDPRHAGRVLPHRQPPRVLRHLRPGRRRALAGLLHVRGPRAHLRPGHRAHLRRPHARQLVPHRRRGAEPADGLGAGRARLPRLPAGAPGRVRPPHHGQPHPQGAHRGRRARSRWRTRWSGA